MMLTIALSLVLMAALFVLIYAAVGLIQNNKLFTTAPKDIQAAAAEHPERFPGARILGWKLAVLCLLAVFPFAAALLALITMWIGGQL